MKYPKFKTHTDATDTDTVVYEDGQHGAMMEPFTGEWIPYFYNEGAEIELSKNETFDTPHEGYMVATVIFNDW